MANEGNGNGNEKPKRKLSTTNLLLAFVTVLALAAVVMGAFSLFGGEEGFALPQRAASRQETSPIYRQHGPQDFTVNLADSGQRRYLRVTVTLAYEERRLAKELEQRDAQIRDLIIAVLRSKSASDVEDGEGTQKLRETMIAELNATLANGEIRDIYFTEFLVQ